MTGGGGPQMPDDGAASPQAEAADAVGAPTPVDTGETERDGTAVVDCRSEERSDRDGGEPAQGDEPGSVEAAADDGGEVVVETDLHIDDAVSASQVAALLEVAGIETVISVDDQFEPDLAVVLDAIARAPEHVSDSVAANLGVEIDGDPSETRSAWEPEVRSAWEDLDETRRRLYVSSVLSVLGDDLQPDVGRLSDLLPPAVSFVPITAGEWSGTYKQRVIDGEMGPTLVLFDLAHGEGADAELGLKLAGELHDTDSTASVWAGLLTHTVDPSNEIEQSAELASKDGRILRDRFVVISKKHLEVKPSTFPHGLKVTLMAPAAHRMRAEVLRALQVSTDKAHTHLDQLDPYEFERAIFGTSVTEGIWEPDMLLRLYNVIIRGEVRSALHDSAEISKETVRLRQFSEVDLDPNRNLSFKSAQAIRRQEIYEDPAHLNGRHLPIELGDLFAVEVQGGNTKTAVLVEQPCDLMVRARKPSGERSNGLLHGHLLEVRPDHHGQSFDLPAYEDGRPHFAHFARLVVVPLVALDYCVYNEDGLSRLDVDAASPPGLWPAWEHRYRVLVKQASMVAAGLNGPLMEKTKDQGLLDRIRKSWPAAHFGTSKPIACEVDGRVVRFNVKRVGRVLPPYSRGILTAYSAHRARADYEPEFPR